MSDLGHAIILLVHFHSLCSFVFACNLNDEIPRALKVTGVYFRRRSKPCLRGMLMFQNCIIITHNVLNVYVHDKLYQLKLLLYRL